MSGTVAFTDDAATTTFTLSGGLLTGSGTFTIAGAATWTDGTMSGPGQTIANGGLAITVGFLDGRLLTINGGASLSGGGALLSANGAALVNNGLFDIQSDASIQWTGSGAAPTFTNSTGGVFRKSGGSGTTGINW